MENTILKRIVLLFLVSFLFVTFSLPGECNSLTFKQLSTLNGLPTNEVLKIFQDKTGFIWIATSSGLCKYDGYQIKNFRRDPNSGIVARENLLAGSSILCINEDNNHCLWIGTSSGLFIMDRTTGEIRKIQNELLVNNYIASIVVTKNNNIFIGTDTGLFKYLPENDTFIFYNSGNSQGVVNDITVKSLIEDSRGCLWIGTWSSGIFRYDPGNDKFVEYPRINSRNSGHVIFEDSKKRIWIGTWGEGLLLLNNPYNLDNLGLTSFRQNQAIKNGISDNFIYAISEDLNKGNIWIGTRGGLSIINPDNLTAGFKNYYPDNSENSISFNEVNSVIRDNSGMMWLGMLGGGVNTVKTKCPDFTINRLDDVKKIFSTNSVRSILVDNDGLVWMGLGSFGLFVNDRIKNKTIHFQDLNDFRDIKKMPTITSIIQSKKSGNIIFGTYGEGLLIYDKYAENGKRIKNIKTLTNAWLGNNSIYSLDEDGSGRIWIGTRQGIYVSNSDGSGFSMDSIIVDGQDFTHASFISSEHEGKSRIWLGTNNMGLVTLNEKIPETGQFGFEAFNIKTGNLNCNNVQTIFLDSRQRLWVGTDGGGLSIFNKKKRIFEPVNLLYKIPGDAVYSIMEDRKGNLWMGTNVGLAKLSASENSEKTLCRLYTVNDNLQDNIFVRNSCFMTKKGEMFFGGHKGYNSFYPEKLIDDTTKSPIVITDIKIFNNSLGSLPQEEKDKISQLSADFTKKIKLSHNQNNFSIEFAVLTFINSLQSKYAYMLEGFDKSWQYTDATRRFAYYNNLKEGTYVFRLKAANENGLWCEMNKKLEIIILPPPWKTWWAYLIYTTLFLLVVVVLIKTIRNRIRLRNELHIKEVEQAKAEELNHAKLQFFTNITHELLTPLTIISASLDELKSKSPGFSSNYQTMDMNINRLIRLLQQILEFRKAESGNLKLKVSKGDLSSFLRKEVDSFSPLMKKKKIHFSFVSDPEKIIGYFDSDKLDKILYNLMSNAAKYNVSGGFVQISVKKADEYGRVLIIVKDNGKGISQDSIGSLFKRFYEGDYRKFNTIGTGIGLSLTKDLVELHGGIITVESLPEVGTTFFVTIPIERSYFKDIEIDDESSLENLHASEIVSEIDSEYITGKSVEFKDSLLLIEDNEDLLKLMEKLLGRYYRIFTAFNGKEGLDIIENEEIDLVVSDIMMPEMDGIEFCRLLKSNLDICHIPIILLTAKNKEEDRIDAYDSGADGYIPKPFNLTVLHAKIKNLLKNKERTARDFKRQFVFELKDLNYTSIDETFLKKAVNCVHNHLDFPDFDQLQFAVEMGTSKSTLYKKLKSLTGLNTSAFIRNIRLKAACKLVEEKKNLRISELAYAVGFNDPKYFSSCFRKEFGMLPSEYIERYLPGSEIN